MRISDWSSDVCSSDLILSTSLAQSGSTPGVVLSMKATLTARRALLAALFTSAIGLAMAQTPAPKPAPAPAALSDRPPIPTAPEPTQSNSWELLDDANGPLLAGATGDERVGPAAQDRRGPGRERGGKA